MTTQEGSRFLRWRNMAACLTLAVGLMALGCTRTHYRSAADRESYAIERERMFDPRWQVPDRPVEANPVSRMADPFNPDREPIPPDDPAARQFQVTAGRPLEFHGWNKRGVAPVENDGWRDALPRQPNGAVLLTPETAMQIAVMNSRDYQTQVENVYLQALSLTLARFQFAIQPYAASSLFFSHFGAGSTDSNQLQLSNSPIGDGFSLQFLSGAQLLTNFANSLVWEYHGGGFQMATSNLMVSLTQPLLRGATARVVTQPLSVDERNTLYTIRMFAEYRRSFYVNIVAANGFLGLLEQLQNIRNAENIISQYKRSLDEYQAQVDLKVISPLQRDQMAQQYLAAQINLLQLQASLQTSLDAFKGGAGISLGLPPDVPVEIDDSLLRIFELNDPRLDELRARNDKIYLALSQFTDSSPSNEVLNDIGLRLIKDFDDLKAVNAQSPVELERWKKKVAVEKTRQDLGEEDLAAIARQEALLAAQASAIDDTTRAIDFDVDDIKKFLDQLGKPDPPVPDKPGEDPVKLKLADNFRKIQILAGKEFRNRLSELFVAQTQARVFLIELPPVDMTLDEAIATAFDNRQDLMNALANVTDQWRNLEVDANALQGYLNLVGNVDLATGVPRHHNVIRFDASNSTESLGIQFEAPLNRRVERNNYRAQQITYQRARRAYMANHDLILQQIRADMRQLVLNRRQFEINREQLLILLKQVDIAEYNLRNPPQGGDSSGALYLTTALSNLLGAKNSLIANWVSYNTTRMSLYRDFDTMDIDAKGVWTNEPNGTALATRRDSLDPKSGSNDAPQPANEPSRIANELEPLPPRPEPDAAPKP